MTEIPRHRFGWLGRILAVFGIIISPHKKHPVHLSKVFFFWVLGGFLLTVAGSIGMYSYSTNPSFCNSCHIMTPYYQAWETSKHHGKAVCVDCHYPPAATFGEHLWHKFQASAQVVKYVTRTYSSKPFAEIADASCLRSGCHSTRLLEGKVVTAKGIKFDHRPHLTETRRDRQLRCVSCHSQIVVGNHVEVTYSTCFLCHFRDNQTNPIGVSPIGTSPSGTSHEPAVGCLGCHDLPEKSFQIGNMSYNHKDFVTKQQVPCKDCHSDIVHGDGKADASRCLTCHNQPEKLARYGDIPFIHENHVTKHHVACLHCHQEMRHGFQEGSGSDLMPRLGEPHWGEPHRGEPAFPETAPETTPAEHPANLAFDCSYCHLDKHSGQLAMYTGQVKSLGLPEMPSPMYLANVDCIGCHYLEGTKPEEQEFKGHTVAASPNACLKCHGKGFEGIWSETMAELKKTLVPINEKIAATEQALVNATLPPSEKKSLENQLNKAKRWYLFVSLSRGDHNIYLAATTLRKIDAILGTIGQKLTVTLPDLSTMPLLSGGYCATMCHERIGVKVPPETVKSSGKMMPHKMHTELMGCVACHEIGAHKKVPLRKGVKEAVCVGCHP